MRLSQDCCSTVAETRCHNSSIEVASLTNTAYIVVVQKRGVWDDNEVFDMWRDFDLLMKNRNFGQAKFFCLSLVPNISSSVLLEFSDRSFAAMMSCQLSAMAWQ